MQYKKSKFRISQEYYANDIKSWSFQMKQSGDRKPGGDCECSCGIPSLGQLQKKFLNLIAKLFYKHGKFVSLGGIWSVTAGLMGHLQPYKQPVKSAMIHHIQHSFYQLRYNSKSNYNTPFIYYTFEIFTITTIIRVKGFIIDIRHLHYHWHCFHDW